MDTSVDIAGVAGFKSPKIAATNSSANLIRQWTENHHFAWLVTDEILDEYKNILGRRGVRSSVIGRIINRLTAEAEVVVLSSIPSISPDPGDDAFCACAEQGLADFIVTLNSKDFPQHLLGAHVIAPEDKIPTTRRERRS